MRIKGVTRVEPRETNTGDKQKSLIKIIEHNSPNIFYAAAPLH